MTDISLSIIGSGGGLTATFKRARNILGEWRKRDKARQQLARMNVRELSDIGLTQADQSFEVSKPFWAF